MVEILGQASQIMADLPGEPTFTPRGSAVRARQRPPQKTAISRETPERFGRFICTGYHSKAFAADAMNRGEKRA